MDFSIETVTPKKAQQYLNKNRNNRALRDKVVERYATDMLNGAWTQCTVPIAFYDDKDIADGQHRLWAIVESGKSQQFIIVRGLPKEAGLNIDTGLNRSLVDAAKISGTDDHITYELIGTARAYHLGSATSNSGKGKSYSNAEKMEWIKMHREPCEWAVHHRPVGKYLQNSLVLAAIARAYTYEKDHERLKRFSEVLSKGFAIDENESAAIAIRNYLINNKQVTSSNWSDVFLKMQNAIWYFMRKKPLFVIKGQSEERYPRKDK